MFQIGDRVVYGSHGICCVTDEEHRRVDGRQVVYLALEPVGQTGSRFLVPTHNPAAMAKLRKLLTREQAEGLLNLEGVEVGPWIQEENRRKQSLRELITCGDCFRLMDMVGQIYRHKTQQAAAGRKLHMCDENFLRDAERLLVTEISAVLERTPEEVRQQLRTRLSEIA